jgi:hypothetical protein
MLETVFACLLIILLSECKHFLMFDSLGKFACALLQGLYVVSHWREKSVDGSAGWAGRELADDHTTHKSLSAEVEVLTVLAF